MILVPQGDGLPDNASNARAYASHFSKYTPLLELQSFAATRDGREALLSQLDCFLDKDLRERIVQCCLVAPLYPEG